MRILTSAEMLTEVYEKDKDIVRYQLRQRLCDELTNQGVFIEPPLKNRNGNTEVTAVLFALTYDDIRKLDALKERYPDIRDILDNIIIER